MNFIILYSNKTIFVEISSFSTKLWPFEKYNACLIFYCWNRQISQLSQGGSKSPVTPVFLLPCQWACSILLVNDKCTCCANLALFDGDWVVFKGGLRVSWFPIYLGPVPFFHPNITITCENRRFQKQNSVLLCHSTTLRNTLNYVYIRIHNVYFVGDS